jgi:hypothetical protein
VSSFHQNPVSQFPLEDDYMAYRISESTWSPRQRSLPPGDGKRGKKVEEDKPPVRFLLTGENRALIRWVRAKMDERFSWSAGWNCHAEGRRKEVMHIDCFGMKGIHFFGVRKKQLLLNKEAQ